jgi:DNA-binding CsgD family transcriptional regulator
VPVPRALRGAFDRCADPASPASSYDQTVQPDKAVIGRDAELAGIAAFVTRISEGPAVLLIEGDAGVGKTTLWHAGVNGVMASAAVLSCRPAQTEATMAFAGLSDLLAGVIGDVLGDLPAPQRRALEAALLLSEGSRSDHQAVGAGTLSALRALAARSPVLIAVDDVQWLDRPSARALAFAVRRLEHEPVRMLASLRSGLRQPAALPELAEILEHDASRRLRLGRLSVGAVERLLADALGMTLPRSTLLRLHETTNGNPFFALEVGRALAEAGAPPGPGEPLPVPDDLHDLLVDRVRRLPASARDVLLLASLLSQPTEDTLERVVGDGCQNDLDRGRRAGIIDVVSGAVRFTHPLFASAVAASVSPRQRRGAHARLAVVVAGQEERARHLALATAEPDERVAHVLEEASADARRRGAPAAAAELAELARGLTPAGRPHDVCRRCTMAGDARFAAGDTSPAAELFTEAAAIAAPGAERAEALWHLARVRYIRDDVVGARGLLEEARGEAGDDTALCAAIEHDLVYPAFASGDLGTTLRHARAAADLAERVGAVAILAGALSQIAVTELMLGQGVRWDLLERARQLEDWDDPRPAALRPTLVAAHIVSWLDRLDEARSFLLEAERELVDRGDDGALPWLWYRLAELDCWTGDWERGLELAVAADKLAVQAGQRALRPPTCYAVALLAAHLGRVDQTREAAEEGAAASLAAGLPIGLAANLGALGFLELSLGNPDRAHQLLGPLLAHARAGGLDEPALLSWLPDEIEALVTLGHHDEATAVIAWVDARARAVDRASGLATAARGRALLSAARGDSTEALRACDEALGHHDRAGVPFQRARTLFTRGQIARRARKWGVARSSLTDALGQFEALGAVLWAERARDELARIGGRPAAPLDLSDNERQIAELVAAGRTNREVAEIVFVSPRTVSATLARIYRKLGVSSRTEMAARLGGGARSA